MMCNECNDVFRGIQRMANGRRACEPCAWIYYCDCCGLHTDNIIGERVERDGHMLCTDCANTQIMAAAAAIVADIEDNEVIPEQ